jgi:hypothetical protein
MGTVYFINVLLKNHRIQPVKSDIIQNTRTIFNFFIRISSCLFHTIELVSRYFRIVSLPSLQPCDWIWKLIKDLPLFKSLLSITEERWCSSCLWHLHWNLMSNKHCQVVPNRALFVPGSWIFTFGFKSREWCTEHTQTRVNSANRSFVCKASGKQKNVAWVQVFGEVFIVSLLTKNKAYFRNWNLFEMK